MNRQEDNTAKTVYLHIGMPKTGTSSIQVFCRINRRILHKYGYDFPIILPKYPGIRIERNAHFLDGSASRSTLTDFEQSSSENQRLTPSAEQQSRMEKKGFAAVHKGLSEYDSVILSDESLWYLLNPRWKSPLELLCKDALEHHYCIKIVVYLRRQDQFLFSQWNQRVKLSSSPLTFSEHVEDVLTHNPYILDYARSLDWIAGQVGRENVIVRRFEKSSWVGGTIYTDFLDAVGLDPRSRVKMPKEKVNTGLLLNFAELQRQINRNPSLSEEEKDYLRRYLINTSLNRTEHTEYGLFSTEETREFLARYAEGNATVARKFLNTEGSLFTDEIKETKKWHPDNEYMEEDICSYLTLLSNAALGWDTIKYRFRSFIKRIVYSFLEIR